MRNFRVSWPKAVLLTAMAVSILVLPVWAQENQAPESGSQSGIHWSPYSPPASYPEGQELYTIVRGDTLWSLAGRFYGDPLLWPYLWDANKYILDSHWIYPGDPLAIPESPEVAAARMAGGEDLFGQEPMPTEADREPVPVDELRDGGAVSGSGDLMTVDQAASLLPDSFITESDLYCGVAVLEDLSDFPFSVIVGEEETKVGLTVDDVVYLDTGEDDGISAGDRFEVVVKERKISHPATGRNLGWAVRHVGTVEVLCVRENDATAVITDACGSIEVGSLLTEWEDFPIPMVNRSDLDPNTICDEPSGEKKGYIIYSKDDTTALGEENLVVIDRGTEQGTAAGDFFTIYRDVDGLRNTLGELVVVRSDPTTSLAKISASRRELYVGDQIEAK